MRSEFIYEVFDSEGRLYGTTTDIYNLPVGTKFHVENGFWYGEIISIEGVKHLKMGNESVVLLEENKDYGLVISIEEETRFENDSNLYVHYKGGLYEKLMEGTHTENEEILVVYRDQNGKIWIRPKEMFENTLIYNGKEVKRFSKVDKN